MGGTCEARIHINIQAQRQVGLQISGYHVVKILYQIGINAMTMALISLLIDRTVRSDTAMTGEISLRGLVLPVGGI